jgi:RNA polymerase sigma-70 factor, ECF subfamily
VRSWLFSIVRRVVADDIQRRQRRRRTVPSPHPLQYGDHAGGVALELLLHQLDHDRRSAFVLTQLWGFTYDMAAHICDCPVGTIRSRVARARLELTTMLRSASPDHRGVSSETA